MELSGNKSVVGENRLNIVSLSFETKLLFGTI